ncbi:hypothetical protein GCM10010381_08400 [Streptomyces xantholiticus]|nr:hypothetical protein [Streptomyces xantholiticus]GGW26514.1 hypothetical protein GCM10010381_08400 [Streptomyces xantholiticus]
MSATSVPVPKLPEIVGPDEFDALVIRTDYGSEAAWHAVMADLAQPWGDDGEFEAGVHFVDDPVWANATPTRSSPRSAGTRT